MEDRWLQRFDHHDELLDAIWHLQNATTPLQALRALAQLRIFGAELRHRATADARAEGATWAMIAEASKTSRQAEHRRYGNAESDDR